MILNVRRAASCSYLALLSNMQTTLLTLGAHACSEGYCSCPVCMCVCMYV